MTTTANLDLLDEFSECPVPKADRSLDQKIATDRNGSLAADRLRLVNGRSPPVC
jgi:hypothetical protein